MPSSPAERICCGFPGTNAVAATPPPWTPIVPSGPSRNGLRRTIRPASSALRNCVPSARQAVDTPAVGSVIVAAAPAAGAAPAPAAWSRSVSHSRAAGSAPVVTNVRPSAERASPAARPTWAGRAKSGRTRGRSQTRTVLSCDAVTSVRPSPLMATPVTGPVWPEKRRSSFPVAASQRRAVPSVAAVTTRSPSGVNWAANAAPSWPRRTTSLGSASAARPAETSVNSPINQPMATRPRMAEVADRAAASWRRTDVVDRAFIRAPPPTQICLPRRRMKILPDPEGPVTPLSSG